MSIHLKHFSPEEIIITEEEARIIYKFLFKEKANIIAVMDSGRKLKPVEIEYAQALLVHALDKSYDMSFVAALFHSLTSKKKTFNSSKKILKKFGKKALKNWFEHATEDDLWDDPEIYETVRLFILRNFSRVAWEIIGNGITTGY